MTGTQKKEKEKKMKMKLKLVGNTYLPVEGCSGRGAGRPSLAN